MNSAPLLALASRLTRTNKKVTMKDAIFKNIDCVVDYGNESDTIDDVLQKLKENEIKHSESAVHARTKEESDFFDNCIRNEIMKQTGYFLTFSLIR